MKDGRVRVIASKEGDVVRVSTNNPEYGNIRVTQDRFMMDDNGFLRPRTVSALIAGRVEDLMRLGLEHGQEIDGRIYTMHSMTPFNAKDGDRDLKIAGETEVPCTIEGQSIYMKSLFSFDSNHADGERIQHDNGAEIKAAYAALKANADSALEDGKGGDDFEV